MNPHGVGATAPLDLAAIATFNNGVARARDDYAALPNAACYAHDCDELARTNDVVCGHHRHDRNLAALRMRVARNAQNRDDKEGERAS